jgi:hypothetical protein
MSIQCEVKRIHRQSNGKEFPWKVVGIEDRNTIPFGEIKQMCITAGNSLCGAGGFK